MRKTQIRNAWFIALVWGSVLASTSQNARSQSPTGPSTSPTLVPRSHEEREHRYRAEHHVILNVLVVDASDRPVSGLQQDEFTVSDNGYPQKLASFQAVNGAAGVAPVHTILLLDTVNSTNRDLEYEMKQVKRYLASHQGALPSPTSLAILGASGMAVGPSSSDGTTLAAETKVLFKGIQPYACHETFDNSMSPFPVSGHGDKNVGFSIERMNDAACLNEKFQLSLRQFRDFVVAQENTLGRVILIWIGPGWPHLSGPEFLRDTVQTKQKFFDNFVELSRILREAQVTVDAISSPAISREPEASPIERSASQGVRSEEFATARSLALQSIATQSGGRVLEGRNIADSIAICAAEARMYYALSFDSLPASKPDEYHSLQVKVSRPGLRVLTTTSYYGEP